MKALRNGFPTGGFTALILMAAALGLTGCVSPDATYGSPAFPPPISSGPVAGPTLTPAPLLNCVPIPRATYDTSTRTATPDMFKPHTPQPYVPRVTPTSYPFTRVVDLDPASPMEDKHVVEVYGCDGTYSLWYMGMWRDTRTLPLRPGDQVLSEWLRGDQFRPPADLPAAEARPLPTPESPSLDYDHAGSASLVKAEAYTSPLFDRENSGHCNYVPNLQIWGDGKTVYSPDQQRKTDRQVLAAQLDENQVAQVVATFDRHKFFAPWTWTTAALPSGGGFGLTVHINDGDFHASDNAAAGIYQQLLDQIGAAGFAPFVPEKANLKIGRMDQGYFFGTAGEPFAWPDQMGFEPSEVGPEGREISGPGLAALWERINSAPDGDLVWADAAGKAYWVWLEIPGVIQPRFPEKCAATQVPVYPPGTHPSDTPTPFTPPPTWTRWPGYPVPLPTDTPTPQTPEPTRTLWPGYPAPPPKVAPSVGSYP